MSKPTPGPWEYVGEGFTDAGGRFLEIVDANGEAIIGEYGGPSSEDDARLIAEAGTVFHETGLTPRELAAQRAELLGALRALLMASGPGDRHDAACAKARAAIARATGQAGKED